MVRRVLPFIRQHETHRQLAGRMRPPLSRLWATPDAIIVPATRNALYLDHAMSLARALNCWLVVFCSMRARAAEVNDLASAGRFHQVLAVDLEPGYTHKLLDFTSSGVTRGELPATCENPNGDLSTKRNLGLLLARMMGWERIFFMDDDIRDVAVGDLRATIAMLGRYRSAGMRVAYFPDNSVVCHANRLTGGGQDVFVSGSVLAVNAMEPFSFFPEVYNEDWLFFYDDARSGRLGSSDRDVTQLSYDPFKQPQRAERQEFGDVLAEGLYAFLDEGLGVEAVTGDHWNQFLAARRDFLEKILECINARRPRGHAEMVVSVNAAMTCLMQTKAAMYERYVEEWRKDIAGWTENVKGLQRAPSIESALGELDLTSSGSGPADTFFPSAAPGAGALAVGASGTSVMATADTPAPAS